MRGEEAIDTVLAAPPREFVAVRNRVASALEQAGDGPAAAQVRALRRPSPSVWAVNRLAHREADAVEELLEAGARLVKAQRRAITGDGAGFLDDARAERQKVAALARRAEAILAEAGQRTGAPISRRIAQTLHAAAVADAEIREALRAGRLLADLEPPGELGAIAGAPAIGAKGSSAHKTKPSALPGAAHARSAHEAKKAHVAGSAAQGAKSARAAAGPSRRAQEPSHPSAAERKRARAEAAAATKRERAETAAARKRERAEAAAAAKRERAEATAARRRHSERARASVAAERAVAAHRRAVDDARSGVERAEQRLRAAKDALAAAELAAQAARRAADASD